MAESEPTWTVIGQVEDYRQNESGAYVQGMVVTFRTDGMVQGSVFVPNADYNAENVKRLVTDKAKAIRAVHNLQG